MFLELARPFFVGLAVTAAVGGLIGLTKRWHGALSNDGMVGPHKFHRTPTPRIGGLAVYAGYWAAAGAAPPAVRDLMFVVSASAAFAFLAGVIEDSTKRVRVSVRLTATVLSGLVFCLVTDYAVTRLDIPFVDHAMALPLVAIAFTAFAMAGLAHAINIIDGFHGLATGSVIIMLVAFAVVSLGAGDRDMALFCFAAAGVLSGFLMVNFPLGYVFLGDGGAYFLGFVLAAVAIMVPMRNPDVSPWISVVILTYPLLETAFSVIRKIRRGGSPFQPDRRHLHMLVYRRLGRRLAGAARNERLANPATGALMWSGAATGLVAVALVPHDREWSLATLTLLLALYTLAYRKATVLRRGVRASASRLWSVRPAQQSVAAAGESPPAGRGEVTHRPEA